MANFPQALPVGTVLGNFKLRAVLGHGGGGFAYLCYDELLERRVVLKEHFPHGLCRRLPNGEVEAAAGAEDCFEQSLNLFLQEARTLASLRHAGVVRILEVLPSHGTAVAVMEPVTGETLDVYLTRHATENTVIEHLLRQLLGILTFLHGRCVIHRDIKPSNIVVQADGSPVLLDFGAALRGDTAGLRTIIGTPTFAAPEQFDERGTVGPWSDIYALGAAFLHVLGPERVSRLPKRLRRTLYQATRKDADRRFHSAVEWQQALRPKIRLPLAGAAATLAGLAILASAFLLSLHDRTAPLPNKSNEQTKEETEAAELRRQSEFLDKKEIRVKEARAEASLSLQQKQGWDIPTSPTGFRLHINPKHEMAVITDAELQHWQRLDRDELCQRLLSAGKATNRRFSPWSESHMDFPEEDEQEKGYTFIAYPDKRCALLLMPRSGTPKNAFLLTFLGPTSGTMAIIGKEGNQVSHQIPFELSPLNQLHPKPIAFPDSVSKHRLAIREHAHRIRLLRFEDATRYKDDDGSQGDYTYKRTSETEAELVLRSDKGKLSTIRLQFRDEHHALALTDKDVCGDAELAPQETAPEEE